NTKRAAASCGRRPLCSRREHQAGRGLMRTPPALLPPRTPSGPRPPADAALFAPAANTKRAAPHRRRRRCATASGLPSLHLHCRTGRPVVGLTTTLGLPGRSCLGRLPRLVARGYPVSVSAPLAWYVIHFYDGSTCLGRAARDQFVIFIVPAVHMSL